MVIKPKVGIVVDGSCRPNPGKIEWRGVNLATREEVFRYGPIDGGTNNIAEFLAIVHALCKFKGLIYSDSQTARRWIAQRAGKMDGCRSERTLNLMQRANAKLQVLSIGLNQVLFWDSYKWGPNPADFGYKR